MNIAIISPSPKPFAVGGIEKLMLGLYYNIDKMTDHKVELFKIPTEENGFWPLINSYKAFYKLDLSHFDMVISCKYPAWMINHHNHIIYMAHHLRGLFDTYHFMNIPETMSKTKYVQINQIIDYASNKANLNSNIDSFFDMLDQLYKDKESYPETMFSFPGPFIRTIIHFLDKWAIHPARIKRYTSISNTVKNRKDYFPRAVNVEVIYPPTSLEGLESGAYEYFLIVGRLDGAKRVELIVKAMKLVENPKAQLLIAGTGPDESRLKELAGDARNIKFLGYINNESLSALYKNALAVIYIPYDEDYGLATIEAMHCKKPVITCFDSGGTTEFVKHEITGLVAESNPESLSLQLERLIDNIPFAMELGQQGFETVKAITWSNMINSLLNTSKTAAVKLSPLSTTPKQKMVILSTYPVFPKQHGGQLRIYNLYYNLKDEFEVTIVSFNDKGQYYRLDKEGFIEISIPKTQKHQDHEWEIEREVGIPITDIAMEKLSRYTPEYHEITKKYLDEGDILIASHPYLFHLIEPYCGVKKVFYDAHNVEYELKKNMLPDRKRAKNLLKDLYDLEQRATSLSDYVLACSKEDIAKFKEVYKEIEEDKFILIPNGVDLTTNKYTSPEDKKNQKEKLGLVDEKIVVFIGSWHKPNLEAVEHILELAPKLPEYHFIIMGGQCEAFKEVVPPNNVAFAGVVSEEIKSLIYSVADVAINPMVNGSGTNLKIAEYMANGVPVISTEVGARGYNFDESCLVITDLSEFFDDIKSLMNNDNKRNIYSEKAYNYIKMNYAWTMISKKLKNVLM
ncbi:glycosyltransferase involved in cell wall biosynthesis [Paenibacillus forsythiae]|uniref:Glycosyltransferase involved in cell wall biosynthesis n=1 Tax=Paenibacillus forsythiae TaxID=365616 RepID=A0ABU3HB92_9BACL|nr:glycosyltransferase [Paenibacillus forsythiae]MDT3428093.1 glycosyltransferase involved in cell wall biosynthesis [Paenibacillus forsythiae]